MSSVIPPCESEDWTYPVNVTGWRVEQVNVYVDGGQVDVNVTNSQLDVNITNSLVPISIENATITVDVATVRERAPELGKVYSYCDTEHLTAGQSYTRVVFRNNGSTNAYLELITVSATNFFDTLSNPASVLAAHFEIKLKDEDGNVKAKLFANPPTAIDLNPALAIPPGWTVEVEFYNGSNETLDLSMGMIIRTE